MSTFPGSPRLLKGGLVLIDPRYGRGARIIALQYNPDTLTRTLQVAERRRRGRRPLRGAAPQGPAGRDDQARRRDRRHRPARVSRPEPRRRRARHPAAARGARDAGLSDERAAAWRTTRWREPGTLEIAPMEAPLTLFVWSKSRIVPVRVTDFSITEEAFDPALNPIRAKVSLGLRVLTRRRPRLRPQGRQPVHGLSAAARSSWRARARGRRARARSASEGSP